METRTTRSGAHRVQTRAVRRTRERSAKAKSVREAKAKKAAKARAARKADDAGVQLELFDNRPPSKRRFPSGEKIGRPPKEGAGQRHERRPDRNPRHPLHVVTRLCPGLGSLRTNAAFDVILEVFREAGEAYGVRVLHFSIQSNHIHLIVEVDGGWLQPSIGGLPVAKIKKPGELAKEALARGLRSLLGRIAIRLNRRVWGRKGKVFAERYYAVAIDSPLQMKRAIAYVLNNGQKHGATVLFVDPFSSGRWFDGWERAIRPAEGERPTAAARTWLAREGWKRHGPVRFRVAG